MAFFTVGTTQNTRKKKEP